MAQAWIVLISFVVVVGFLLYLLYDFITIKGKANAFWDKWVRRTLWLWLPFYALQRLIKEVILKK